MRAIGKFTTFIVLVAAGIAAVAGVKSIDDIKRYLKMREM
jgi:hypothetical protein